MHVVPIRTSSFGVQRTPSFVSTINRTFIESDPKLPRHKSSKVTLTPHHIRRGQSFRLQRTAGIRPGSVAADRRDRHDSVADDDDEDVKQRFRRSDSVSRGRQWEENESGAV